MIFFQPLVKVMVKYGKPNWKIGNKLHWEWTPLHSAVLQDNVDIVKVLLDHGADPNAKDSVGRTPQKLAEEHYKENVVKFFKQRK